MSIEQYDKRSKRRRKGFMPNVAQDKQSLYESFYFTKLSEIAASRFEWSGLPKSIDVRFLENTLMYAGLAVVFLDDFVEAGRGRGTGQLLALRGSPSGGFNPMDNPTRFTVTGNNFPSTQLHASECVPIWANFSRTPETDLLHIYAHKFATLDTTIDINSRNARRTKVAFGDENQRLTNVNIARRIDEGDPVIYTRDPLSTGFEVADFGVDPKGIEVLHVLKVRLWNECMMMLGIHGANQDKKERLVASEVDANDEQIEMNRITALNARQIAAEQITVKYGIPVSVDFVTQNHSMSPAEGV